MESLERSIACLYIAVEEEKKDNHSSRTAFGPKHDSSVARHYHKLKQQHQDQLGHGYGADKQGRKHRLLSFPWIAAIVCLKEVDKLQRTMPF